MPTSPPPAVVRRLRAAGSVFAEDEARLLSDAARSGAELAAMVNRRAHGLPLEQILGWAEFCGLRIALDPGVFVPRVRTEFMVEQAVAVAEPGSLVVDLCCGSGAVGVAVAAALGRVELHAADVDPAAVACARRNVAAFRGEVYEGDLFEPLPARLRGHVDVLVANVPYVPTEAIAMMPPEARSYESPVALDGGSDGLDVVRRVTAEAAQWLAPDGHLLVETSASQVGQAVEDFIRGGLAPTVSRSDDHDATVISARRAF